MGSVCLEEFLDLDLAPDGICLSPALHYNEGSLLGDECVDQIMHGTSYVGWRRYVHVLVCDFASSFSITASPAGMFMCWFVTSQALFPLQQVLQ
jgi:hypothetical protein